MHEHEKSSQATRDLMSQYLAEKESLFEAMHKVYGSETPVSLLNQLREWWGQEPISP